MGTDRQLFQREYGLRRKRLTEREWRYLWEYPRTGSNALQAARVAYGGIPISFREKGHKEKAKLKPILDRVSAEWSDLTSVIIRAPFIDSKNPSFIAVLVFDRMRKIPPHLGGDSS
jgi:hypothetical protein